MHKIRNLPKFFLFMAAAILYSAGYTAAVEEPPQGNHILLDTYHSIQAKLERNSFGSPLYLESSDQDGRLHVDVYGIFDHPFSSVVNVLRVPANWCDIAFLHPNVKACIYRELPGSWRLTFYTGRKVYQLPADAHQFTYHYRNVEQRQDYMDIVLSADRGPFGTKDHTMRFEALPLDGSTFVHVSYTYTSGFPGHFAGNIYFATFGRSMAGFTVTGSDSSGTPVYIGGLRGATERNAVRYFFAIQSFMDTLRYPEENRFSTRISRWHDLTSRFRRQLFDLDKKDYVAFKTEEHKNQMMLQRRIAANLE
jgi:hypothetical protein